MTAGDYFELRCAVLETFYGTMLAEKYTVGQAADRCLVEFRRDVLRAGWEALAVLACLLARVARHDRPALARFAREMAAMQKLAVAPACRQALDRRAWGRVQEDLGFIRQPGPAK